MHDAAPSSLAQVYRRPDLHRFADDCRIMAQRCTEAGSSGALLEALLAWSALRSSVETHRAIANLRYHQDTRDDAARTEEDFWNEQAGTLRELDALFARTILASRYREALVAAHGPQLVARLECSAAAFAPALKDGIAAEAKAVARYTQLAAEPDVMFRGQAMNQTGIARYFTDTDRATRFEAQRAREAFLQKHGEELDELYDQLVKVRDGMGRALGHADFTPLGYALMQRSSWGPSQVSTFREEIRREVVPVATALYEAQRKRLGVSALLFHDEPLSRPEGNPRPLGDAQYCIAQARTMFEGMGDDLGAFVHTMIDRDLFDLESRPGKAGGGFCASLYDLGVPFVFANFNGTEADVVVLAHECGHAFQAWMSRNIPLFDLRFPTLEACEVHSMGMEFLAGPWMHLFFGAEDAERFRHNHLESRVLGLPYIAAVDHFQHEVYRQPGLTPAQRHALWRDMERMYLPHRDYGGVLPYLERGVLWQRQLHIYGYPFYYIDYALAQTCALQIWHGHRRDPAGTLDRYRAMCTVGGSVSFEEMVVRGGLTSPFQPGCLRAVMTDVRSALGVE